MAPPPRLLASLTLAWAVVWVQRAAVSPVGPLVQAELGAGFTELGLLSTLGVLGGALGYVLAGRWTPRALRPCLLAGLALLAAATLGAGLARTLAQLAAAQALAGVGEGLFYVPALALALRAARPERLGRDLGVLDSGISVGSFAVLLGAGAVLRFTDWRGLFLLAGLLGLLVLPLLARATPAHPPAPPPPRGALLARRVWPVYAAVTLLLFVYFALLYLAPAFLVAGGFTLPDADLVTALAVGLGVPWHLVGGVLADRLGPARVALAFNLLFALGLAAVGLAESPLLMAAALVATYSVGIGGFVGVMILLPRVLGVELAAPAFGVFWGLGDLGGAAGPFVLGAVADTAGYDAALLAGAGIAVAAALVVAPLARGRTRPPQAPG